ncbi:hypothetical protein [Streptomyces sp. NPDC057428]|uniref:hypothetical protein n=1 Tax=Streptomyces sp. NPDC057428 TaxID=3346129 RepID=UPI0036CDC6A1
MADRYLHSTGTATGRFLTRRTGLPTPAPLRRWSVTTQPGSGAVNGQVVRVCGQSLLGA